MLNPGGRLWLDRLRAGLADSGLVLTPADGKRIVRFVAGTARGSLRHLL
jgi:hypothetical protein